MRPANGARVRIGISSCLLGENVRFDGGHKKDEFLTSHCGDTSNGFHCVPNLKSDSACPENHYALRSSTRAFVGSPVPDWIIRSGWSTGQSHADQLAALGLCGYVLKRSSPSCGLERVKVSSRTGMLNQKGRGLFAAGRVDRFPQLPVEEEGRLNPGLRENFVSQVFSYHYDGIPH
jgi:uncharacterized protein YbbK (DUF523 family)